MSQQTSLPLTREVAKRSFDGGREKEEQKLKNALKPLSLSLANAQQLPRQREPKKRKHSFSRGIQESESLSVV